MIPSFIARDWILKIDLGKVQVYKYDDGTFRFAHICDRGKRGVIECAPEFNEAHVVVSENPLTVTPSIACYDCNIHGFITEGVWVE